MIQFENGKGPQTSDTIPTPTDCALSSEASKYSRTFEKKMRTYRLSEEHHRRMRICQHL